MQYLISDVYMTEQLKIDNSLKIKKVVQITDEFVKHMEKHGIFVQAIVTAYEIDDGPSKGNYNTSCWFKDSDKPISHYIKTYVQAAVLRLNKDLINHTLYSNQVEGYS